MNLKTKQVEMYFIKKSITRQAHINNLMNVGETADFLQNVVCVLH